MIALIPEGAMATFAALLLAHVLADFVFQTDAMVRGKHRPGVFLGHIAIVFGLTLVALGGHWRLALAVAAAHLVIDAVKIRALTPERRSTATAFLVDQAAHLASLLAAALWWPLSGAFAEWAAMLAGPSLILSGAIIAILAGGHVVGALTARFRAELMPNTGLTDAGRLIGQLERALIYLFVLIDQPAGIGFLIAAKSILRFDTAKEDQKAGEYVIIGTLASFGWALAASLATSRLLEIAPRLP